MIRWARKQKPRGRVDRIKMHQSINEEWHSDDCPHDQLQYGLWLEMDYTKTWGKWIEAALRVRQYIKANGGRAWEQETEA